MPVASLVGERGEGQGKGSGQVLYRRERGKGYQKCNENRSEEGGRSMTTMEIPAFVPHGRLTFRLQGRPPPRLRGYDCSAKINGNESEDVFPRPRKKDPQDRGFMLARLGILVAL